MTILFGFGEPLALYCITNTFLDTISVNSQSMNRSFREQVEQQTRILNDSQRASRNSLTQSQRDEDLPL